ncbi:hypothetical protein J2129_000849 [Methanofollis sp. W23]|uniref:hypothetical protein n=1 Tax=Methanofollis sp. W23 TaxID=2817849 RepID=UPI001AE347B4|nr:hypothetical protein [Methanofollis sp. W23]MBP2145395.1 hypothetical protein [Methanofollis sp. W23]
MGIKALREDGTVDFDAVEELAARNERDIERARIHAGDVLLSMRGNFRAALADKKCESLLISQNLALLRFREGIDPGLMAAYLTSQQGRDALTPLARGRAVPVLSLAALETLEVPVLSEEAQGRLAACLAACREYEALARTEADLVDTIKEALIAEHLGVRR